MADIESIAAALTGALIQRTRAIGSDAAGQGAAAVAVYWAVLRELRKGEPPSDDTAPQVRVF